MEVTITLFQHVLLDGATKLLRIEIIGKFDALTVLPADAAEWRGPRLNTLPWMNPAAAPPPTTRSVVLPVLLACHISGPLADMVEGVVYKFAY